LGYVYLTGLIEAVKTGIPNVLPPEFMSITKETLRDQGRYTRVAGTRRTARRAEYGAPSRRATLKEIGTYDVKLNFAFEHIAIDLLTYVSLRAYDSYQVQNMGMQELDRQALQFRARFDNLDLAMVYSMLANGLIWFDANGNLLPTASGAALTIDYGMSASHQNQLNGILDKSWDDPTADIPTHILAIKDQAIFDTGYELGVAMYGRRIPSLFAANTLLQQYLARWPHFRDHFLSTNEIPDGFFGLKWMRVSSAFFQDSTGTNQTFFDTDAVVFTPPVESFWYEKLIGSYLVPTTFNPLATLQATSSSFEHKHGMFMYGIPVLNPISAELHAGNVDLPVLKFPDAIFQADVVF
jgi:hypothetical protein